MRGLLKWFRPASWYEVKRNTNARKTDGDAMRIIAVDPGETIGVALYDSATHEAYIDQTDDPRHAEWWVSYHTEKFEPDFFIVENYNSAGYLSKEGKHTIKVLGLFELGHGFFPVAPQARLAFVDQAKELIGDEANKLHRKGRDAISALAHCLAYADTHG